MVPLIKTITLLVVAALLAAAALLVPAHLRAIDESVLELAAQRTTTPAAQIREALSAAESGRAQLMIEATLPHSNLRADFVTQIEQLQANTPTLKIAGGPDRAFRDFLNLIQPSRNSPSEVIQLLLPRSQRASLANLLTASSNANVRSLLEIRNLSGLHRLHPANHAAGAPYDAGLLTLAMLIDGGHLNPSIAQNIGALASQAGLGTGSAIRGFEDLIIATLSLGRQLDYTALSSLAHITESAQQWRDMATLFRSQPNRIAQLYTALFFSKNPSRLHAYLTEHPETGNSDLDFALKKGSAAVQQLLRSNLPIYQPHSLAASTLAPITPLRPESFTSITLTSRTAGLALKFALLFLAGLTFAWSMGAAWRGSITGMRPLAKSNPIIISRDLLISLVFILTVWSFFEPSILKSHSLASDSPPRIEFAPADSLESLKSTVQSMQELNQVTLLVLTLFFIIQLVIYSFGLIKLREISKQAIPADLKIKLLENEENLFDFGLYVGLGGTVLSLILVAVGIVEASLMAAYASTLFGILFTALLKILHLRPYRRELIMQASTINEIR